jgi:hypothetical protein
LRENSFVRAEIGIDLWSSALGIGMAEKKSDIMISRAANALRKAAALDRTRRAELSSVADYLETMVYEDELRPLQQKGDDAPGQGGSSQDGISISVEAKRMMTPFKVRLVR